MCCYIKTWGALSSPRKALLTICQTADRAMVQVHIMNSHSFPLSLLSELKIDILALEVWFCSLETSSWRLSQIEAAVCEVMT